MKKIRLGNDLHISWEILRNGEPEDFTDKIVEVKLVHAQTSTSVPIEWSIEGNIIEIDFLGKDQKRKGEYRIYLTENRGEVGMSTLDTCGAFYLVDHSCQESETSACSTLKVQHVRLTGSFSLSGGRKGSEGFVLVTYNGDITDDDYNKLYESIKSGNSVLIKFVEVFGTEGYASILSSELRSNGDIFFAFNDTVAVQAALISGESVDGYHALTLEELESGGSFPNVDELPAIDNLTGEEKVILTLQGENYQTNMNKMKEWVLQNGQFISYPTMAAYDADKANLTEECYVGIDETEEVFLHKLKAPWNAYYELEEAYVNLMQEEGIDSMVGGAPLTLRADMFESFVVNGEERITGNEVFDENDPTATAIVVPMNVGDVYEVSFVLKDLNDFQVATEMDLFYLFFYSPLVKIIFDKSFASANVDSATATPYAFAIFGIQGCIIMREITFNFETDPWKDTEALDTLAQAFRKQGGLTGMFGGLTSGERIARIPNGDWGKEYSEGADLSSGVGLLTVFTLPDYDYNYTIERYDYGTI